VPSAWGKARTGANPGSIRRPGTPLGKCAVERVGDCPVGCHVASWHAKSLRQRHPVDHRGGEIGEGLRFGSGLGDTGAGKLGLQNAVAAIRAHHEGQIRILAHH